MKRCHFLCGFVAALYLLLSATGGHAGSKTGEDYTPEFGQAGKHAVWVPTPQKLVDTMLDLAQVTTADYVIDLGSGDGRLVITAAKRGAMALGIEYNQDLVEFSKRAATAEGVSANARFEKADIFESDFSKATVVTLFILPWMNLKLRPKILDMQPGTRIVSNTYGMGDWEPDQTVVLTEHDLLDWHTEQRPSFAGSYLLEWNTAHLWIVPAKINGTWQFNNGKIRFTQEFQEITGTLTMREQEMRLRGKLDGNTISFSAGGVKYTGTVSGNTIAGTHSGGGVWKATR